jgi:hypothetical protein
MQVLRLGLQLRRVSQIHAAIALLAAQLHVYVLKALPTVKQIMLTALCQDLFQAAGIRVLVNVIPVEREEQSFWVRTVALARAKQMPVAALVIRLA